MKLNSLISSRRLLLISMVGGISLGALAEPTEFTTRDLDAVKALFRPEKNLIRIDGREGVYLPSPALRYFGVDSRKFPLVVTGPASLLDIHFDHVRSLMPIIELRDDLLVVTLPIEDRRKAIRTNLGAISLRGVSLVGALGVKTGKEGEQDLEIRQVAVTGTFDGTGLLNPQVVISEVRKILSTVTRSELNHLISRPEVQLEIRRGLLLWAGIYSGEKWGSVRASSIRIAPASDGKAGILYDVER